MATAVAYANLVLVFHVLLSFLLFTEENLISILYDFFTAAGDTTGGTMAYALLWLVLHPDVQEKCYQEIVRVIGKDRSPQLVDKVK